jgi:hypothetical protein
MSLTFPFRFLSHAAGEEGGDYVPRLPPGPLPLPRCGRGAGGEGSPSPSPSAPTRWERRGDARSRGDPAAVQITPLPRCGRGAGGEGYPYIISLRR